MKRSDKVLLGLAIIGLGTATFYVVTRIMASRQRDAAMARLLSPPTRALRDAVANMATSPLATANDRSQASGMTLDLLRETGRAGIGDGAWQDFTNEWEKFGELTESQWREGEQLASKYEGLFAHATAIASYVGIALPHDYGKALVETSNSYGHEYLLVDALGDLLLINAELAFRRGDADAGVKALATAVDLAGASAMNHASGNSAWLQLLLGAYRVMGRSLPNPLPPTSAQELIATLGRIDCRRAAARDLTDVAQMLATRWPDDVAAHGVEGIGGPRSTGVWYERAMKRVGRSINDVTQSPAEAFYASGAGRALLDRDIAVYLDLAARTRNAMLMPCTDALPIAQEVDEEAERLHSRYYFVQRYLRPAVGEIQTFAFAEAVLDLAQLGILIERFHADFNHCPENLDAIAADLPSGLPADPYSGNGYIYKVDGAEFHLYSVGSDQRDDGGASGDIVWRRDSDKRAATRDR